MPLVTAFHVQSRKQTSSMSAAISVHLQSRDAMPQLDNNMYAGSWSVNAGRQCRAISQTQRRAKGHWGTACRLSRRFDQEPTPEGRQRGTFVVSPPDSITASSDAFQKSLSSDSVVSLDLDGHCEDGQRTSLTLRHGHSSITRGSAAARRFASLQGFRAVSAGGTE